MLRYRFAVLVTMMAIVGFCGKNALSKPPTPTEGKPASQPVAAKTTDKAAKKTPTTQPTTATLSIRRLPASQEAAALKFIKQERPDAYPDLAKLKQDNPRRYRTIVAKWYNVMEQMNSMPKRRREADAREKDLQIEIAKFVQTIRQADGSDKAKYKLELYKKVSEHFEAEQRKNDAYVDELEFRLEKIRREIRLRNRQRKNIISERVRLWMRATKPAVRPAAPAPEQPAETK